MSIKQTDVATATDDSLLEMLSEVDWQGNADVHKAPRKSMDLQLKKTVGGNNDEWLVAR
ncbi:MAG: hypothetical protein R3C05_20955 [Pirellulaceae bacterium]